jgi:hypothetical protein
MPGLLRALRADGQAEVLAPQPTLRDLDGLVAQVQPAGLRVVLVDDQALVRTGFRMSWTPSPTLRWWARPPTACRLSRPRAGCGRTWC